LARCLPVLCRVVENNSDNLTLCYPSAHPCYHPDFGCHVTGRNQGTFSREEERGPGNQVDIIAVYCHKYGRILAQLEHPNVTAVQMFRLTFACIASHVSDILQTAIGFYLPTLRPPFYFCFGCPLLGHVIPVISFGPQTMDSLRQMYTLFCLYSMYELRDLLKNNDLLMHLFIVLEQAKQFFAAKFCSLLVTLVAVPLGLCGLHMLKY